LTQTPVAIQHSPGSHDDPIRTHQITIREHGGNINNHNNNAGADNF